MSKLHIAAHGIVGIVLTPSKSFISSGAVCWSRSLIVTDSDGVEHSIDLYAKNAEALETAEEKAAAAAVRCAA